MAETRRSGINPEAYLGVEAYAPPNFVYMQRDPTPRDYFNERIGNLWLNQQMNTVWMLAELTNHVATWIRVNGGAALNLIVPTDFGAAVPDATGHLSILGIAGLINTDAITANTVRINLTPAIQGRILLGTGGGTPPVWGAIVSTDASITVDTTVLGTINLHANAGANGINSIHVDLNVPINPVAGIVHIIGAHGINVTATAGDTATVAINNSIVLGDLAALAPNAGALRAQTGDIIITAGDLTLPNTNAAGNQGIIKFGGSNWIHNYGVSNTFIGQNAGNHTLTVLNAVSNVGLGTNAGQSLTTGAANFFAGVNCAGNITTGHDNVVVGEDCGTAWISDESNNIMIGSNNPGLVTETGVIRIGPGVLNSNNNNTFVGMNAGNSTYTLNPPFQGVSNTAFGLNTLSSFTTAAANTALGANALVNLETGEFNTAVGSYALGLDFVTGLTAGDFNTACGGRAGNVIANGSRNLLLGFQAGFNYVAAESDNIMLHSLGQPGENNTLRIGRGTGNGIFQLTKTFISGIRGVATGIANAIPVLIDSSGQLGTASSSIRYKENIKDLTDHVSEVLNLRPVQYNYKKDESKTQHYGLIAEEVAQIMPELVIYNEDGSCETVKYDEIIPLLLNELKKLKARIDVLEKKDKK